MSKIGVSVKIDVSKIDKARLFKGAKGTYLDTTVFIDLDELDQYGNSGMVTQDVSKEEREQKVQGNILGNVKVFWSDGGSAPQKKSQASDQPTQYQQNNSTPSGAGGANDDFDDDIPFMRLHWMEGG